MRGCLSLRVVDKMAEGKHVQEAVNEVLDAHIKRMALMKKDCDAISLIAMDKDGNCAASTNICEFPFVVLQDNDIKLFVATYKEGMHNVFEADETWLKQYKGD